MDRWNLTRRAVSVATRQAVVPLHEALALIDLSGATTTAQARAALPGHRPVLTPQQAARANTWLQRLGAG